MYKLENNQYELENNQNLDSEETNPSTSIIENNQIPEPINTNLLLVDSREINREEIILKINKVASTILRFIILFFAIIVPFIVGVLMTLNGLGLTGKPNFIVLGIGIVLILVMINLYINREKVIKFFLEFIKRTFTLYIPLTIGITLLCVGGAYVINSKIQKDALINAGVLGFSIAIIIVLILIYMDIISRCSNCEKWAALEEIDREEIDRKDTSIKKNLKDVKRDGQGNIISTTIKEVCIPGYKITYKVTEKCKFCGKINEYDETKIVEK